MTASLTLVLGGARSGKSRHAETLAMQTTPPWTYVATAELLDDEMRARVAEHRVRRGAAWQTIDAPLEVGAAIASAKGNAVLVDCLTLWVSNLMHADCDIEVEIAQLEAALDDTSLPTYLVASEVGLGIVPENALARRFRDIAGRLHQRLATKADAVLLTVAGYPLIVK